MSDVVFEILKVIVMLAVLLVVRYLLPWIKKRIETEKLEEAKTWVKAAVLMAQQVHNAKPGAERKAIVIDFVRGILIRKNIDISAE